MSSPPEELAIGRKLAAEIGIVAQEAVESVLWLELLNESGITKPELTGDLLKEARELTAILTASRANSKKDSVRGF